MIILPGGFSGGDEPDGSGKFIASFFRNQSVTQAVRELLFNRDGLILGICNGFQALIKLGLVPYGDIVPINEDCPTLTHNVIGRHQSRYVTTRVCAVSSPWLRLCAPGETHSIAVSHAEGRFTAPREALEKLIADGQIATQYCDENGNPSMDIAVNPNGSLLCVEGVTSPDGRVFGKMGHTERAGELVGVNIAGNKRQKVFEGGVGYYL
jgi:phosphoribosylformylglycinamidine synthase